MKKMSVPAGRFLWLLLMPALLCAVFLVPAPAGAATPGIITTVAGKAGVNGYTGDGGPAVSATLWKPVGVAVDTHGDLYIADSDNDCIREISGSNHTQYGIKMTSKDIYTVDSGIDHPGGLALDKFGNLYIADNNIENIDSAQTSALYELTAGGSYGTLAGNGNPGYSGDGGPAIKAEVDFPQDVAVDASGNIYITDYTRIREVAVTTHTQYGINMTAGDIYTVAGNGTYGYIGDGGPATSAEIWDNGVAVDGSGNLYISDWANGLIREVAATDHTQYGIEMNANDIYTVAGNGTVGYAGDGGPAISAELYGPMQITCDSSGNLYICTSYDRRIREVDASGVIITVAGGGNNYPGDGGPATSAELADPEGVAVEGSGAFFISDYGADTIRKVSYYSQKASLGVSSPNVLLNGTVLVYATVFDSSGNLDTSGGANVSVTVTGIPDPVVLKDDGTGGDCSANDGVYSADVQIPGPGTAAIDLTVNGVAMGSTSVNVITDPDLLVLTDLGALYNEFENTGMTPTDDLNGNGIPDYYDLLTRLNQYAGAHHGIVIDLPREITVANGYASDYSSLSYGTGTREMGSLINALVYNVSQIFKFRDVAIIGDDSVVPFYRMANPDPDMKENEYPTLPEDLGTDYGNPTLEDSALNYIMTDVPYASFTNAPDLVTRPQLDAGIGRIFADSPNRLAQIIDGYETPVKLEAATRSANLFNLHDETKDPNPRVNWPNAVKLALTPILGRNFTKVPGPAAAQGDYAQLNGENTPWKPGDVAWSATNDDLTLLWSHATHMYQNTEKNPDIVAGTYNSIPEDEPGHVVISTGCHSGYSVGHVSNIGDYTPYDQSLVKSLINKEVTYIAPTTYGIGDEQHGVAYHDLILSCFLDNLLNKNTPTVGDAQVAAYRQYWATCKPQYLNVTSTYATFGTELYGLPTQPDDPPAVNALPVQDSPAAVQAQHPKAPGDPILDFAVDIPNFEVTTDSQGNDLFQVPNDNSSMINAFAPCLPLVEKSFLLPAGSTVNRVTLDSVVKSVYQGQVNLQTEIPVNETTGPVQGSFTIPSLYPDSLYWYSAYPEDGGVMLTVSVVPMQYVPGTKQVTLYNQLQFSVDYSSPATAASISGVQANNGNPLQTGTSSVTCSATLSSSSSTSATLLWEIRDNSGVLLGSGNENLQLSAGSSTYDFTTGTLGWSPGPAEMTAALSVGGSIVASQTVPLMVDGISLQDSLSPDTYDTTATTGSLATEVMDEQGAPVSGLTSGSFSLAIDGTSVAATVSSGGSGGAYSLSFPITGLAVGGHDLTIACTDSRSLSAGDDLSFSITPAVSGPTLGDIYTVVGNGTNGYSSNGTTATEAALAELDDVKVDGAGNIYISDIQANAVYEVAATTHTQFGINMTAHDIYVVAGHPGISYVGTLNVGQPAAGNPLDLPFGVAVDTSGNLYIADRDNNVIREVAATTHTQFGINMTANDLYDVAGDGYGAPYSGGYSGDGGPAISAELEWPEGVAVDASGNLYIADTNNDRIREVAATTHTQFGINMTANDIYTIAGSSLIKYAGDGVPATSAGLDGEPQCVAVDSSGNLYIATGAIQEVAATDHTQFGIAMTANDIYTVAGGGGSYGDLGDGGPATEAFIYQPEGLAIDGYGNLFIADNRNDLVRKVDAADIITTVAGTYTGSGSSYSGNYGFSGDGGPATSAELSGPVAVALDSAGDLYIADYGNCRIREVMVVGAQQAAAPLAITTGFLPPGTEGTAYDTTLAATGGTAPYTWQAAGLPSGLSIGPDSGEISGTPQAGGDFSVTATVYDSSTPQQICSAVFDLAVSQPLFSINATSLPSGTVGTPYSTGSSTLVAGGGTAPYTWSAIGLPGGLGIAPASGIISGTPAASGDYSVAVSVLDSSTPQQSCSVARGLVIGLPSRLQAPTFNLPTGIYDTAQSITISNPNPEAVSEAVYYTVDQTMKGIDPTGGAVNGVVSFTGPSSQFLLSRSATVEAVVYDHTLGWSIPAVATYQIRPDTPVISPPGGAYTAAQSATITGIDEGDTAYYTTDGSDPETSGTRTAYGNTAFTVSQSETVTARVYDPLTGLYSGLAAADFTIVAPSGGGGGGPIILTPAVQTEAATSITANSAVLNGDITSDNNSNITDYGFLWGASSSSLANKLDVGADNHSGAFTATLGSLTTGTTYYFEAYATNSDGTADGAVLSFTAGAQTTTTTPATPTTPTTPPTQVFPDVPPSYWAYGDIENLNSLGYVSGYPDGTFKPGRRITRAEFCAVMDKVLKLTPSGTQTPTFTDVNSSAWFYQAVETAVQAGIAKGYGDGTFHPDAPISRQEIACVLVQALGKSQLAEANAQAATRFTDNLDIAWWARGYIFVALQQGIINGYPDGAYEPRNETIRAEACAMVENFLNTQK